MSPADALEPQEAPGTAEQCQIAWEILAERATDLDEELYLAQMIGLM